MRQLFAVFAALGFVGSAYAADLPVKAPPLVAATTSWTGWYVGINGGWGWGDTSPRATDSLAADTFFAGGNVPAVYANGSTPFHNSGGVAGGQIGYLYQINSVILGLEAGFDWMGLSGSRTNGPFFYPVTAPAGFSWNLSSKSDWLFTFLSRFGYDMGSWYPYITGGLAVSHLKYSATYNDTFYPSTSSFGASDTRTGLAIGGGIEWKFAPHLLLRGEYLYVDLGNYKGSGIIRCTPGVGNCVGAGFQAPVTLNIGTKENIARLALSYQF